ncbi:hypothetical protein A7U60_g6038 [Sanghuangporus baumii]|uniref:C2H2-type domain-containing protein n=1 Tax=Sanghuangporus baumii TaxID=108892 RepID=A0A9Q5N2K1_SANBA|nr:hypothetical protein A7U60_g6038 [Sanghuangporus baumii]
MEHILEMIADRIAVRVGFAVLTTDCSALLFLSGYHHHRALLELQFAETRTALLAGLQSFLLSTECHVAPKDPPENSQRKEWLPYLLYEIYSECAEQLTSPPPHSSPRPSRSIYNSGTAYPVYASESRPHASTSNRTPSLNPDIRFGRVESTWSSPSSQRASAPGLRPSLSYGASFSEVASRRPIPEHHRSHESSPAVPATQPLHPNSGCRYGGSTDPSRYMGRPSGGDSSRSSVPANAVWTEHRRRDSMDSVWSSHSSSSAAPSQQRFIPPSPSNALQFQPLPQPQTTSSRLGAYASAHNSNQADYQSPFGVLIADNDSRGATSSDPQRTAIIRTLRASGIQGSFQINFDDPANAQSPPRYSCQYCGKGFARPSSLRIHNNSHTGEKPFQCPHPDCGRRFSVHSNMRRHYRVHEGSVARTSEGSGDELADE